MINAIPISIRHRRVNNEGIYQDFGITIIVTFSAIVSVIRDQLIITGGWVPEFAVRSTI